MPEAVLNEGAPKPPHVPESVVYDYDLFLDKGMNIDPHARLKELVQECPDIFWTPRNGGHWVLMSHATVFEALRNWQSFSSATPQNQLDIMASSMPEGVSRIPRPTPITFDPPDHTELRKPLQSLFTPKAAIELKNNIETLADQLIDNVKDSGHCDFVPAIAEPLPVIIFLRMLGLPVERLSEFRDTVHEYLAPRDMDNPLSFILKNRMVVDSVKDIIIDRQDNPQDDLLSKLWQSKADDKPVTCDLIEDYVVLLFIAGLDTVVNGLSFCVRHLAQDQDLQALLREKPELISTANEEAFRRYGFIQLQRRCTHDLEIGGQAMKKGDEVVINLAAANLDHRRFPDPFHFDIHRKDKTHILFGAGPHRCLGSHLARVELQILVERLLTKLPPFQLDPAKSAQFHSGNIIAVDSLPLQWNA